MPLSPGDSVEHFVIVSALGAGGMGQVYLARDTQLQRSVALKIVQPGRDVGSEPSSHGTERLMREAQAAAGLEHPNVVTIYEVGKYRGSDGNAVPYIAMELVRGKALRAYAGDRSVPMQTRIAWLADIARALHAAHLADLVHRDIKPENVMIRDDGVVKVLDFGLAKRTAGPVSSTSSTEGQVLPSLTAKGVAVGTPYYMAPEQMRREQLDGRADQFSWGVVAYELLSAQPAWGNSVDALELVSKLLTEQPPPLAEVARDVPANVAAAVTRALSKKREDRFATMAELLRALVGSADAFAPTSPGIVVQRHAELAPRPAGPTEDAPPSKTSTPVTTPAPRRRAWPFYALGAGVLVAGGAIGARALSDRAESKVAPEPSASNVAPVVEPPECTKSTECITKNGGKPFVCNKRGVCAAVDSEDCKARYEPGDLERDDTI